MDKVVTGKFAFVILHYLTEEYTESCVSSVQKLCKSGGPKVHIYVVDNASPDGSGQRLYEKYSGNDDVTVILGKTNAGFARGNNAGFRRAKKDGADFIILINNDTEIKDPDFLTKTVSLYEKEGFAVLGPDIYCIRADKHQNPAVGVKIDAKTIPAQRFRFYAGRMLNLFGLYDRVFEFKKKHSKSRKSRDAYKESAVCGDGNAYVLHGSCLIFSEKYINVFDGLDPRTFMYMEEEVLAARCRKNGLKMVYSPALQIIHYQDAATDATMSDRRKKNEFLLKNSIRSLNVLEKVLKED